MSGCCELPPAAPVRRVGSGPLQHLPSPGAPLRPASEVCCEHAPQLGFAQPSLAHPAERLAAHHGSLPACSRTCAEQTAQACSCSATSARCWSTRAARAQESTALLCSRSGRRAACADRNCSRLLRAVLQRPTNSTAPVQPGALAERTAVPPCSFTAPAPCSTTPRARERRTLLLPSSPHAHRAAQPCSPRAEPRRPIVPAPSPHSAAPPPPHHLPARAGNHPWFPNRPASPRAGPHPSSLRHRCPRAEERTRVLEIRSADLYTSRR